MGGFDFYRGNFNRVTQACRRARTSSPSSTPPLERGLTPATQISDLPFELSAAQTGSKAWTPKNYGNQYEPMLTLRQGLPSPRTWCRSASCRPSARSTARTT